MGSESLTSERLKEVMSYDPDTGVFVRLVRSGHSHPGDIAGSLRKDGYWHIRVDGNRYLSHRLAWLYMTGEWPKHSIDHINRDRADNRIENLRDVPHCVNTRNVALRSNNRSGLHGVWWDARQDIWRAYASSCRLISLGSSKDFFEAVCARKSWEALNPSDQPPKNPDQVGMKGRLSVSNTSGIRGVGWNGKMRLWVARASKAGKMLHLGSSESLFEAVCMRKSWDANMVGGV